MLEVLRHAFGFCGEHWHPNLFTIILSGFGILPTLKYLYVKIRNRKTIKNE